MTFGRMEPKTAGRVAEMLGFVPEQVLPNLDREIKKKGDLSAADLPLE